MNLDPGALNVELYFITLIVTNEGCLLSVCIEDVIPGIRNHVTATLFKHLLKRVERKEPSSITQHKQANFGNKRAKWYVVKQFILFWVDFILKVTRPHTDDKVACSGGV